jgi:hypothetical protein
VGSHKKLLGVTGVSVEQEQCVLGHCTSPRLKKRVWACDLHLSSNSSSYTTWLLKIRLCFNEILTFILCYLAEEGKGKINFGNFLLLESLIVIFYCVSLAYKTRNSHLEPSSE